MFVFKNRYIKTDVVGHSQTSDNIGRTCHIFMYYFLIDMEVREYKSGSGVPPLWKA